MSTNDFDAMMTKVKSADGFIAALDQSGGSTPKALGEYGVPDDVSFVHGWFGFGFCFDTYQLYRNKGLVVRLSSSGNVCRR
jgi:hypothetical protein